MLLNRLDYGIDPDDANDAPRMLPLTDDYRAPDRERILEAAAARLVGLGILVEALPRYDYHMAPAAQTTEVEK